MWTFHKLFCFLFTTVFVEASGGEILLVSHNHGVLLVDVDNGTDTSTSVVSADRPVVAFDVHRRWRQLFWATETTIYRTPLYDLSTTTPLAEAGHVGSLAVDWVHHTLYWTDLGAGGGPRLEAAHLDGRGRRVVRQTGGGTGAMVLDPLMGKLFWIGWDEGEDNNTRIMTCNLDGYSKKTLYESESIPRDSPLAIDVTYNAIYFHKVTTNSSELWEVNYQVLGGASKLYERHGESPSSLCLSKVGFYFSNKNGTYSTKWVKKKYTFVYGNNTDHIFSLDPYFHLVDSRLKNSLQIRLMSEVMQPQWPDQCGYHQCEHECVVISRHQQRHQPQDHQRDTACVCRYGYVLREDGRTCEERGYLVYSTGTTVGRMTPKGEDNTPLYNDSSANIQSLDVDVISKYVYWSDLSVKAIYRAPLEQLARRQTVVAGVTAYGLAVDWVHGLLYWSDQSRVLVVSVEGGGPVEVVDRLDSPGNIAVDPVNRYIFWEECGSTLSIRRAGLDGSDVITLVSDVTCGMSLTADLSSHMLYFIDWAGAVSWCQYDGSNLCKNITLCDVLRGVAIVDHQPLWAVVEDSSHSVDPFELPYPNLEDQLTTLAHDLQPSMVKVVKTSHQPGGEDVCAGEDCEGMCLPNSDGARVCACSGRDGKITHCPKKHKVVKGGGPNDYLAVMEMTPFSVTLRCSGPLMKHNKMRPWVRVDEVDSLVPRGSARRESNHVHVYDSSLPFTVDGLNPATTYVFTVQHGVTRGSWSTTVHTPPPPLALRRLPVVTVPGIPDEVQWEPQGVHYDRENPWEHLLTRKYFLLLLSKTAYTQSDSPSVPKDILDVLRRQIKMSFIVLSTYISEEDFDDDPEMYLANLPWGETFQLAMIQTTEYRGSYNLDIVYSRSFALPDPHWRPFVEEVLRDQEVVGRVERL